MAALLTFNGTTIIDDSSASSAYGRTKEASRRDDELRYQLIPTPGAAGFLVKVLDAASAPAAAKGFALGAPTRLFGATLSGLETHLATIRTLRRNSPVAPVVYRGRTITNILWATWRLGPVTRINSFSPDGNAKTYFVDVLEATFVQTDGSG